MTTISLITATLNCGGVLEDALHSVRHQAVSPEHIVIDGGSTDETLDILERRRQQISKLLNHDEGGIYDALNKGIQVATGDVIGVLHADDMLAHWQVLSDVADRFTDRSIDAVYGDLRYVDRNKTDKSVRHWRAGNYSPHAFYRGWMLPHPTLFVRRDCYEKHGLYRLDLGTAADYELMLRFLLVHEIRVTYIPRVLVKMRVGGASNATLRARLRANRMDRRAWKVNGLQPHPWTLIAKPLRKVGQWWQR